MINWLARLTGETQARLLGLLRRSRQTITTLAEALGLTDNAVRMHIAALHRDGIVEQVGTQRDTGGKPARVYGLTREGEELFPKAYALVLGKLVAEIGKTQGRDRAIELLRAASPYEFGFFPRMLPTYIRGQAYLRARQGKEAAAEFQKVLDHRGACQTSPQCALAHLQLARARVLSGDAAGARGAYQDFFAIWKDADPDIPILKEARSEYAKLN